MTEEGAAPNLVIHPAKLPALPADRLRIEPDTNGVVATDPERSGWRYLSFRTVRLAEGEVVSELVRMLGADSDDSVARQHARELRRAA